jgi:signal transduction histidine kinase
LLQAVIAAALVWPDRHSSLSFLVAPQEAASIAKAMESATPEQQALIVQALNHGRLTVSVRTGMPPPAAAAPYLNRLYTRYTRELDGRPFLMERGGDDVPAGSGSTAATAGAATGSAGGTGAGRAAGFDGAFRTTQGVAGGVRLLVGLKTGQVLELDTEPLLLRRLAARLALVGAATALILLLVMLYCVRQIVLPARRLANAARRLAVDIDMPDLPTRGTAEIATLSASFNEMKRTIRGLMQERTRMLAAIAHDLRTYLTRLRLRADFITDADQRQRAVRDLDEMAWLLDDTLTFARETVRPARVDAEVIDARAEVLRFAALRREIGDPLVLADSVDAPLPVRCSPLALRRILSNLADNAIRYGQCAYLSVESRDGRVMLTVDDDGPGVPPALLARLAQPFERGEPSRGRHTGGSGLGLAIVKALAQSQGGELHIGNRPEGGLRVTVALPLPSTPADSAMTAP